jgi:heme exporter protein B
MSAGSHQAARPLQGVESTGEPAEGAWAGFGWALRRDLRIAVRSKAELGVQLLFYVIVVTLFPLSTAPDRTLLATLGPGVLWVAALLASLLSLPRLFASDFADGTLEQLALSPYPLPALVSGKITAHWVTTGLPVALLAPLLGLQYALDDPARYTLAAALLIGTPVLSLLGAVGAGLTLGLRGGGSLLALLVLPLYVPVLIFGAGAVDAVRGGLAATPHLALLGACLLVAAVGAPLAAATSVRIALE